MGVINCNRVVLANADIAATGVITMTGGISVKDFGGVKKINLSNTGAVTLPNADIAVIGFLQQKVVFL